MYQMPGWASPKHTRSFTLTGGLMTMERFLPECFMTGIGEGMNDRGVPCGKEVEGNDLLLMLLDDHVQDRCTLIGPTSGTQHRLHHGTQYDVHRTRFSSRQTYRSYLGGWDGRLPSHVRTLLLISFAHVHVEYEDEHGTASLGTLRRSSQASRRDTSASERLQASTLNYGVGLVQCDGVPAQELECGEPYDPASGKTIELRLECCQSKLPIALQHQINRRVLIARKKPPAEISLSTLHGAAIPNDDTIVHTAAGGMMIMDDRYQTTSPVDSAGCGIADKPGTAPEGMADIHGYCKGVSHYLLAAYDMQARKSSSIQEQSNSEGVNYPAGNTCPFGVDTSLLSPKRDKSSHIEDLRDQLYAANASASPAALTRIDWTRKEASRKGFQAEKPTMRGAMHFHNPEQDPAWSAEQAPNGYKPHGRCGQTLPWSQISQSIVSSLPAMALIQSVIGGAIAQLGHQLVLGLDPSPGHRLCQ
ncbi:uncharacterized protein BO96DRAFT_337895 [Aspergillus niger CBS 101883]|uniref:uncharacterized protein n=1 Tax=Aspergillus lacticoffeatus (strain CBS 101883) TaxID=1450533 RepID=UPI000D7F96F3|nr:uncharacterized protein BO96DRAFT_337895 [Aspergillus niger CBS 101883]PYH56278.1 hypothetical protein BO96DRAFT_337895 [Aspergillus niger CBS 101883]